MQYCERQGLRMITRVGKMAWRDLRLTILNIAAGININYHLRGFCQVMLMVYCSKFSPPLLTTDDRLSPLYNLGGPSSLCHLMGQDVNH